MPTRHRLERRRGLPRSLGTIVGVAALATAVIGATDLGRQRSGPMSLALSAPAPAPATRTTPPATPEAAGVAADAPLADLPSTADSPRARLAARRLTVTRISRSHGRGAVGTARAEPAPAVQRRAHLRERSLRRLSRAAEARSAQIGRELRRERREAARQRRIERRIERRNRWVAPVSGYQITATFGQGGGLWSADHTGLDFATYEGAPVGAVAAGQVTSTGYDGSYGNKIVITHDDGTQTWYCHLSSIGVGVGQSVLPGSTIGAVGSTGNTTGPHLHLEVRPGGGGPVDPYPYLQARGAL